MVKSITTTNKNQSLKGLNTPKEGFITKKKEQKFKQTPTGKIPLVNGLKGLDNNNQKQRKEKNKEQKKKDTSKSEDKQQQSHKKEQEKKNVKDLEEEEDDSDSGEDINEGVVLNNTSVMEESDNDEGDSDEDEDEETNIPNILGTSLADDSDSDDEDFEEDEDEEADQVNKGVKMFKGLKKANDNMNSSKNNSDKSIEIAKEDDDDDTDEEFVAEGEGDDDEDIDDEESEVEDEEESEEDDDEEDEDEEDSEEEADESKLGLKALLGNSIADDDDDDEDFVETEDAEDDDDDNISDEEDEEEEEEEENEQPKKNGTDKKSKQEKGDAGSKDAALEEIKTDKRTVFVGNLPKDATKKQLKKLFRKFGTINTIRLRGIVGKSPTMPKKIAAKTNSLHPQLKSVYAYIKFDSEESVKPALSMNGQVLEGNYLRVDTVYKSEKSPKKGVFVGNLSFSKYILY